MMPTGITDVTAKTIILLLVVTTTTSWFHQQYSLLQLPREPEGDHCITSIDCAMNGECIKKPSDSEEDDPQAPGTCRCFSGWKGNTCEELDLLPVLTKRNGLQLSNHSSSWGGSVIAVFNGTSTDGDGYVYHMFASEITHGCGLNYWTTNSQVIRAVSIGSPYGPYRKEQVILPTFAHDANVMIAPATGEIVLFVTARPGVVPTDCRRSNNNSKSNSNRSAYYSTTTTKNTTSPPKDTYMLYAPHPEGPWSEPVLVLNSTVWNEDYWEKNHRFAHCDANLNGIILSDNSFVGLWRRCETKDLLTIPHALYASDWKNASTYQPNPEPLFVLGGSGAEDPSNIWTTQDKTTGTIAYHAIFHDEQATRCMLGRCPNIGRHAFSLNGKTWSYSKTNAYDGNITFSNGNQVRADTRARPHLVVRDNQLLALSTGFKPSSQSGYVWTLVQPLRQKPIQ
eukprot:scaffold1530_cov98-Cylindrotheca_fusiformis.AAC.7